MNKNNNKDSISWHSINSSKFESNYQKKAILKNRLKVWRQNIDKYSCNESRVLDLGCGTGALSFYLAERNKKVEAVDPSSEMLKICKTKNKDGKIRNIKFINSSIDFFSKSNQNTFDLIICSSVLEYVDNFNESLNQIFKMLKKDGILIFSIPNKFSIYRFAESISSSLLDYPKYYKYVKNIVSIKEIKDILVKIKFQIIEYEYFGQIGIFPKIFNKIGFSCLSKNMILVVVKTDSV